MSCLHRMGRYHSSSMFLSEAAKSGITVQIVHLLFIFVNWKIDVKFFRFMVIPDMLKNAPMFKRLDARIKVR